jgi:hypothetical protein
LIERLLRQGVTSTPLARPVAISPGVVELRHELKDVHLEAAADTVVLASGGDGQDGLYHEVRAAQNDDQQPRPCFLIGDAFASRNPRLAIVDGARVGRELSAELRKIKPARDDVIADKRPELAVRGTPRRGLAQIPR